jgi:hypothetical protein
LEDCSVVAYARYRASELPKAVGLDLADGRRRSDGRSGHICHGPYITLGPGRYTAGFYVRRTPEAVEGSVEIEVCVEHGRRMFASRSAPVRELFASIAGLVHVDFAIDAVYRGCEMRLHVPALTQIEVSEAVLFRRDIAGWDA